MPVTAFLAEIAVYFRNQPQNAVNGFISRNILHKEMHELNELKLRTQTVRRPVL